MQEMMTRRTRSNSVPPKENQNIKGFSPNNHFEMNLKFGSKIILILRNFIIHSRIFNLLKCMHQNLNYYA